ncbi:hypothetical protein ACIPRD_08285 [Streptomyces sp. NPDC090108]|uniref:hypothetical protein n=1 Tax=Streptomyces sp. NPDC090108 TaxID=3365947 RepID=UPI00382BBC82
MPTKFAEQALVDGPDVPPRAVCFGQDDHELVPGEPARFGVDELKVFRTRQGT